jgi:hypothetical protein
VPELFEGKAAGLGKAAIVGVNTLLSFGGDELSALFAGHQAAGAAALEAIAIRNMFETADLALAAALEAFE